MRTRGSFEITPFDKGVFDRALQTKCAVQSTHSLFDFITFRHAVSGFSILSKPLHRGHRERLCSITLIGITTVITRSK